MSFSILGTGCALPAKEISNDDLSKVVDTSDEWIRSKTGIERRRFITDETLTELGAKAAKEALDNSETTAKDIDLVICSTTVGDTHMPSQACLIAQSIGINAAAYDINAACSGFIYALDLAAGHFARKKVKKILIVCAEHMSRLLDFGDRSTCVLFGDGASAVVLGEGEDLLSVMINAAPCKSVLNVPFAGGGSPYCNQEHEKPFLKMDGQQVYKFAVNTVAPDLERVIADACLAKDDIDYVILHQANMRIIDTAKDRTGIAADKFLNCIADTGNISSVSIPLILDRANRSGRFKKGDIIACSAFGAGLTTAACVLRWGRL